MRIIYPYDMRPTSCVVLERHVEFLLEKERER